LEQNQERLIVSEKVIVVTAPDDFLPDSYRFLAVDLNESQTQIVSSALLNLKIKGNLVVYLYRTGDSFEWFLDKKNKSDLIIFNADSSNELLTGYLAAQRNSHYFGILKTLDKANKSAIYSEEDVLSLLKYRLEKDEQI